MYSAPNACWVEDSSLLEQAQTGCEKRCRVDISVWNLYADLEDAQNCSGRTGATNFPVVLPFHGAFIAVGHQHRADQGLHKGLTNSGDWDGVLRLPRNISRDRTLYKLWKRTRT